MTRRSSALGAALLALLVGVVWYLRLATPEDVRSQRTSDLRAYFYPSYLAFYGWLRRGVVLDWNPYQACGLPWLGTMQAGFFYPPHLLYVLLPANRALFASGLLHVLLAALGTAAFARRQGFGPGAAAVGGILFALHGVFASWLAWPYMLEASAWLPLGCIAVDAIVASDGRRGIALLAGTLGASWLAGGPQATIFLVYAWGSLLVVLRSTRTPGDVRAWLSSMGAFAAALGVGTVAGLATLLPARELAAEGARAAGALDLASMFPNGYGASAVRGVVAVGGLAGFTALGWSLAPFAVATRDARALVAWAVGVIAITTCFVFGPQYPLAFALYRSLPLLGWFRSPFRILVLAGFAFALLAAAGTDVLVRQALGGRSKRLLGLLVPAAVLLARGHLFAGGVIVAATLAVLVGGRAAGVALCAAAIALATLEVRPFPGALPYDAESGAFYRARTDAYERLARLQGHDRVWLATDQLALGMVPRLATLYGVRSLYDYEPLLLERQSEYFRALYGSSSAGTAGAPAPLEWMTDPMAVGARTRLLDLAAVRYVVLGWGGSRGLAEALQAGGMRVVGADDLRLTLLENPHALPRAFVTHRTEAAPPTAELLARLSDPTFDPLRSTFVEGLAPMGDERSPVGHAAQIVTDEPDRVEIDADLAQPGLLVLADTFAPGWVADVDGRATPIAVANQLFRGVPVAAGHHHVRFDYASHTLAIGVAGSALGWIGIALLARRERR
jgi:hypothetical protein